MIKTNSIIYAIIAEHQKAFPNMQYYDDFVPQNFQRPCMFVMGGDQKRRKLNINYMEYRVSVALIYYGESDIYSRSSAAQMHDLSDNFLNVFDKGYIKVGTRAPKIENIECEYTENEAFIYMELIYSDCCDLNTNTTDYIQKVEIRKK
ncbi:MAG: hypothetical protein RR389_01050 [Christensenella sp.]